MKVNKYDNLYNPYNIYRQPLPSLAWQHKIDNLPQKDIKYSQLDISNNQEVSEDKTKICNSVQQLDINERDGGTNAVRTRYWRITCKLDTLVL